MLLTLVSSLVFFVLNYLVLISWPCFVLIFVVHPVSFFVIICLTLPLSLQICPKLHSICPHLLCPAFLLIYLVLTLCCLCAPSLAWPLAYLGPSLSFVLFCPLCLLPILLVLWSGWAQRLKGIGSSLVLTKTCRHRLFLASPRVCLFPLIITHKRNYSKPETFPIV